MPSGTLARRKLFKKAADLYGIFFHKKRPNRCEGYWLGRYAAKNICDLNDTIMYEDERIKISDTGMERTHSEFNCQKMVKYILDVIETGTYNAPLAQPAA